jgi:hypothetical protein
VNDKSIYKILFIEPTIGFATFAESRILSAHAGFLSAQPLPRGNTRHSWADKGLFAESHLSKGL